MQTKRREFIGVSAQAAVLFGFLTNLLSKDALASAPGFSWEKWVDAVYLTGEKLISGSIDPVQWQTEMNKVYATAPLTELAQYIKADRLLKNTEIGEHGERFIFASIREGSPVVETRRAVITKAAIVQNGKSIPPHGHENMVSAFLALRGKFHVRQFDKTHSYTNALVIRQAGDEIQTEGQWSSVSDGLANCHTLKAVDGDALLFSTKIVEVKKDIQVRGRIYFDLDKARHIRNGYYHVPLISSEEAFSKS